MLSKDWIKLTQRGSMYRIGQSTAMITVGALAKLWITIFNRCLISNKDRLSKILEQRRSNPKPLISVSNHCSCLDDPFFIGALLSLRDIIRRDQMRWGLGAHDVMFKSNLHTMFFHSGKILPIVRGHGIYQPVMDFALDMLNNCKWVHIFPEGKVLDNYRPVGRLKWGVSRLIMECKKIPQVVPIFLEGMERVLPNYSPYVPRVNQTIGIAVGDNLDFSELISQLKSSGSSNAQIRSVIAKRIQDELNKLARICPTLDNPSSKAS
ncbi:hypothetical protein GJ496_002808 [Pomphorhynchus laevis]|nr:hypothetical protein GJ496_002808 [Pomphorhynchus laevis]